jgi:hypothetical protein
MKTLTRIAAAFAAGAALMYYLDPQSGRRRRALARERGIAAGHDTGRLLHGKTRHARDRAWGALARARAAFQDDAPADDVLCDRVRSAMGHIIEHPGQVNVDVQQGYVVVRGRASIEEIEDLTLRLGAMRGVVGVDNRIVPAAGLARP